MRCASATRCWESCRRRFPACSTSTACIPTARSRMPFASEGIRAIYELSSGDVAADARPDFRAHPSRRPAAGGGEHPRLLRMPRPVDLRLPRDPPRPGDPLASGSSQSGAPRRWQHALAWLHRGHHRPQEDRGSTPAQRGGVPDPSSARCSTASPSTRSSATKPAGRSTTAS